MKKRSYSLLAAAVAMTMLVTSSGCGQISKEQRLTQQDVPNREHQNADRQLSEQLNGKSTALGQGSTINMLGNQETLRIPFVNVGGVDYVAGSELANGLDFLSKWEKDTNTFMFGDNDAAYELKSNSTTVTRGDEQTTISQAPIVHNSQLLIPVSALSFLLADDFDYTVENKALVVKASGAAVNGSIDGPDEVNTGGELEFGDDPSDPFKGEEGTVDESEPMMLPIGADDTVWSDEDAIPVLKNININAMIARAKRYLGVKYDFGAKPYPQSGVFDCSTFVQYVYGKYGITFPRTSRAQAKKGTTVSRKSLRKGDLLYFYVPGRFKSNKIVGHVGIYIGNQVMIHSSPQPKDGVQLTNINKAYWKETFLFAKRVAY
ncbi:C40 family peptidase [Paenibacillus sp. YYML68]|uniref:C40 family peptidase n=1 Tax=Paenibacillus sp. YYML68 TaxID=2909250 RepID=UPI00248F6821|nr:C40 family peptidase [Paenibacillus sp. YYML68]